MSDDERATALFQGKTIASLSSDGEWTTIITTDGYQLLINDGETGWVIVHPQRN